MPLVSVIALQIATQQDHAELVSQIEALIKCTKGPLADSTPTAVADVTAKQRRSLPLYLPVGQ